MPVLSTEIILNQYVNTNTSEVFSNISCIFCCPSPIYESTTTTTLAADIWTDRQPGKMDADLCNMWPLKEDSHKTNKAKQYGSYSQLTLLQ